MDQFVQSILNLLRDHGHSQYGFEAVSQLQHALQTATLARAAGCSPELVAAALLHDIGHLLHELPDDAPEAGIDDAHEDLAATYLGSRFKPGVTEPIRLHVAAKRYLCAVEPEYIQQLSEPSVISLRLQGGIMSEEEAKAFEAVPFAKEAVQLRKWDDQAKDPDQETPPLDSFEYEIRMGMLPLIW